ncbi:hypothetical protein [Ornithinimicrobium pekingense]|uniref:DegT/DnrJ/EryC1/StrS aminotransferase family protein n=1 Tax=Ornithinimicrobium pekingense TaxID=384677 RepID=A0ABQ2FBA9_9MICO|nr:hypothetical protein [Ornithinimicrobium pekingense]GGK79241.1 hypothetical protein GCM10011509_29720 [Ornithinimicrobium pekingense]
MREIGSDFETVDSKWIRGSADARPPWERAGEQVQYFESGRQAIGALSRELRGNGLSTVLFPAHYCESMLAPFLRDGWDIQLVGMLDDWTLDPHAVHSSLPLQQTLIFSTSYFGVPESASWTAVLTDAAVQGAHIVSDETHRVWTPGPDFATYRLASLRKLLPLPDGAFLTGPVPSATRTPSVSGPLRLDAMEAKRGYLADGGSRDYRALFSAAESQLDALSSWTRMALRSEELVKHLDYGAIAARRSSNHAVLVAGWSSEQFTVTTAAAPVPAYCVVRGSRVAELRRYLIGRGIYPPVHWVAPPAGYPRLGRWIGDVLSIPIDHRYDETDMQRVLETVHEFEREGSSK